MNETFLVGLFHFLFLPAPTSCQLRTRWAGPQAATPEFVGRTAGSETPTVTVGGVELQGHTHTSARHHSVVVVKNHNAWDGLYHTNGVAPANAKGDFSPP